MTVGASNPVRGDARVVGALLLAAASELALVEIYHRFGLAFPGLEWLGAAALASSLLLLVASRMRPSWRQTSVSRLGVVAAVVPFMRLIAWPNVVTQEGPALLMAWVVLLLPLCAMLLGSPWWERCRGAIAVLVLAFVWSQPLLAFTSATDQVWPPIEGQSVSARQAQLTLVLLFDELNAKESGVFESTMAKSGLKVVNRAVDSVERNTSEAIPSMFAPGSFHGAKACSMSTICAGTQVLDFSRIQATRPDIDVVGIYHPYCAIRGLRSCTRIAMDYDFTSSARWRCAAARRTGWSTSLSPAACTGVHLERWERLRQGVADAVLRAPALKKGGLLFAHIALPHPPGSTAGATLADDYRTNIARANDLLDKVLARVRDNQLSVRVVLISDHPLRQSYWCQRVAIYAKVGCKLDPALDDTRVPLIVAAQSDEFMPSLAGIRSNADVFRLTGATSGGP